MPAIPGMEPPITALCVAPFGMEEGSEARLPGREFPPRRGSSGEPAEFRFLSSNICKQDHVGSLLEVWCRHRGTQPAEDSLNLDGQQERLYRYGSESPNSAPSRSGAYGAMAPSVETRAEHPRRLGGEVVGASRYLIGIDLGTTNSVVAYIDSQEVADAGFPIRVFPIPQLVEHGEVLTLPALPSFIYFPTEDELSDGAVSATWDENPPMVTGVLARQQGALLPSRQVSSAKSWLSYPGVDRRAKILPAQAEPPQPMTSPVEASARYLMHLRDAWNGAIGIDAETSFEHQDSVLTVPASFDEEARELTVEAARRAGLLKVTLLEEPLAAFYSWIAVNRHAPADDLPSRTGPIREGDDGDLRDGELILICDIGGGTTDFSLVRAHLVHGELQFERTAIGEHLLLGGDNFDFALARRVEEKLMEEQTTAAKLALRQRYALRRTCCAAKERLLSDGSSELSHVSVTILGGGRAVVGQALSVDVTREEVVQILIDGFLPITAPDEMPVHGRSTALRELGLPYASDPAITRHLAAFLTQAAATMNGLSVNRRMARPDFVLFNGGFCAPAVNSREDHRGNLRLVRWSPNGLATQGPQQRIGRTGGRECGCSRCCLLRPCAARHRFAHPSR